jgi:AcrR family transcriptional regulator
VQRPGGRTEKNRAAVFAAVEALLADDPGRPLVIADVAERSGVHPTTIYRRWKTPEALALDVAVAQLEARSPLPDTGTLRGDLTAFARQVGASISKPTGIAFLRAVVNAGGRPGDLERRGEQIQTMIDRHPSPRMSVLDVFDGILAPIYARVLFGFGAPTRSALDRYVDNTIALCAKR